MYHTFLYAVSQYMTKRMVAETSALLTRIVASSCSHNRYGDSGNSRHARIRTDDTIKKPLTFQGISRSHIFPTHILFLPYSTSNIKQTLLNILRLKFADEKTSSAEHCRRGRNFQETDYRNRRSNPICGYRV